LGAPTHNYVSGAAADLNGDGRQDLVLCCAGSGAESRLLIAFGNGNGTFQAPIESIPGIGRFDLRDWSGDGRPDVIALTSEGALNVAYGQPNGTFLITRSTLGATEQTVIVADTNNDGILDAITLGSSVVKVFFGGIGGALGLSNSTALPIQGATSIVAADYTGDGLLDLAVSEPFGAGVLMVGVGGGNFTASRIFSTGSFELADAAEYDNSGRHALLLPDASAPSLQVVPFNVAGAPLATPLYRIGDNGVEFPTYETQRSTAALADLNGDGKDDVILFSPVSADGILQVFRGGPLSSLTPQPPMVIPAVNAATVSVPKMLAADLNNDGRSDLILMETETPRLLVYLTEVLTGALLGPISTSVTGKPRDMVLADFNNDGRLDLAVASGPNIPGSGRISVFYGTGTGAFSAPQAILTNLTPHRLAVGDFNGDFKQDLAFILVAPAGTANAAGFVLNRTNNMFLAPVFLPLPAHAGVGQDQGVDAVAVGDVNSDGGKDILIAAPFVNAGPLLTFQGNGQGAFTAKPHIAIAPKVATMTLVDVDLDNNLDLLTSHCCLDTTTSIYYGRPDGTLSGRHVIPTGAYTGQIAMGDVDGDGKPDLMAHSYAGVSVQPLFLPTEGDVISAASGFGPTVAIDSIASFYGTGLAPFAEGVIAEELQGTRAFVTDSAGKRGASPLFYVSPGLVNFATPPGLAEGPAVVTIVPAQGSPAFAEIVLARVAPGIFIVDTSRLVAANVLYFKPDGQIITGSPYRPEGPGLVPIPIDLGPPADRVMLIMYGTGIRGRSSLSQVSVTIGGVAAPVDYAGLQVSYPGFDQLNVTIPQSLVGRGSVDIIVTVEGKASNAGRVVIQ
jgi:uncharacterized protein (TIGR03437 family)